MTDAAYACNGAAVSRSEFYAIACDPRRSVAVEACAGAGKTWMLVSRILRALLDGTPPHEILAITFTRKAAGEMRDRLDEWLHAFARQDVATLPSELILRGCSPAQAQARAAELATLGQRVLDAGRPVQIRTFHSWFAALVREAPLSVLGRLGLPAQYELLEDDADAVAACWPRFFQSLLGDAGAREDFEALVRSHGRHATLKALEAGLARRMEFAIADAADVVAGSVERHAEWFGARHPWLEGLDDPRDVLAQAAVRTRWLQWARSLRAETNKTPRSAAAAIEQALAIDDAAERFAQLRSALFVQDDHRLRHHLGGYAAAQEAEAELRVLCEAVSQHEGWLYHQRMARLMRFLVSEYAALKRERGWVDMTDLECAALELLRDPVLSGWVHERLDTRTRQLLIDEFQDTNPVQWQALRSWLAGYAGAGHSLPVFLVGDPKQSIYRFRRAEPQVFESAKSFICEGLEGVVLSCDHTRRNAQAVLAAVNAVMSDAARDDAYPGYRVHTTESAHEGGAWALPQLQRMDAAADAKPQGDAWRNSLTTPRELEEDSLRLRECRQVARWMAGRIAAGESPGDFMVLARQRERLDVMQQALREHHVPCERSERGELADALEVQDIVALLDVLVSPSHDLSLAQVLRSPLFGVDENFLLRLADARDAAGSEAQPAGLSGDAQGETPGARPATLPTWLDALDRLRGNSCATADGRWPGDVLRRWQSWVHRLPPHDALSFIFHDGDVFARYAAAVPAAQREPVLSRLRGVLSATLALDGGRYLTPYAWVRQLRAQALRAPATEPAGARERGAVSLLTVHGAKGLEAKAVVLLDADASAPRGDAWGSCIQWPGDDPHPRRFAFCASLRAPPPSLRDAVASEQAAQAREELNVLYVAMTRARQCLVLSSSEPYRAAGRSVWARVQPHVAAAPTPAVEDSPSPQLQAVEAADGFRLRVLPAYTPQSDVQVGSVAPTPPPTGNDRAARIGQGMHRLLEWAPLSGAPAWSSAHLRGVAREFDLLPDEVAQARDAAQRILQGQGAWAWDAAQVDMADSEVEITHQGQLLRIDRLVRRRDTGQWWVLDHKSSAAPQQDAALCGQLRTYRDAVQQALAAQGAAGIATTVIRCAFLSAAGELIELT